MFHVKKGIFYFEENLKVGFNGGPNESHGGHQLNIEGIDVFTSGKDGIFLPGSPIGLTTNNGDVKLFSEPSQLSFVKIDISKLSEDFK